MEFNNLFHSSAAEKPWNLPECHGCRYERDHCTRSLRSTAHWDECQPIWHDQIARRVCVWHRDATAAKIHRWARNRARCKNNYHVFSSSSQTIKERMREYCGEINCLADRDRRSQPLHVNKRERRDGQKQNHFHSTSIGLGISPSSKNQLEMPVRHETTSFVRR